MFRNISFVWKPIIAKLREPIMALLRNSFLKYVPFGKMLKTETEELPVWGLWFTIILLHTYDLEN